MDLSQFQNESYKYGTIPECGLHFKSIFKRLCLKGLLKQS